MSTNGRGSVGTLTTLHLCTSGFVDDVMFAKHRSGKADTNREHTQSDSPEASPGAKSDIYDFLVAVVISSRQNLANCAQFLSQLGLKLKE